ncbi:hypothetical protein [Rhizobium mesoamericanum]|nr:hypothetical protein [Rhizobium mesoamericanum]
MCHMKRTYAALLAITFATSGTAFGQFAPPPGGPPHLPAGGPPRPPAGAMPRPQMGGTPRAPMINHSRPPLSAHNRPPANHAFPSGAPNVGGAKGQLAEGPGRGGNNLSQNLRGTLNSGGNINGNQAFLNSGGNIAAKDAGNITVSNSGDVKVSGNGNGYFGRGYYGGGDYVVGGDGGGYYDRGDYRRAAYLAGGYATGVATGAAIASNGYQSGSYTDSSRAAYSASSSGTSTASSPGTSSASSHRTSSTSGGTSAIEGASEGGGTYVANRPQGDSGSSVGGASGGPVQTNSGGSTPINPLILGLFQSLPPDGTAWTAEGAVDWLQAAAANLRVVYGVQENIVVSAAPRGN